MQSWKLDFVSTLEVNEDVHASYLSVTDRDGHGSAGLSAVPDDFYDSSDNLGGTASSSRRPVIELIITFAYNFPRTVHLPV